MRVSLSVVVASLLGSIVACSATTDGAANGEDALDQAAPGVDESALDRSIDPCTDFYAFACGGYIESVPADQPEAAMAFGVLQQHDDEVFHKIVDEATTAPVTDGERKFGDLYASCMASNTVSAAIEVSTPMLASLAAAKTPADLATVLGRLHRVGVQALFGIQPFDRTRKGSLVAVPGGFDEYADYASAEDMGRRTQDIVRVFKQQVPSISDADAQAKAVATIAVEKALATAAVSVSQDGWHPLGKKGLALAAPTFDWEAYFTALGAPKDLGAFNIPGLDYFGAVESVWTQSPDALRSYLEYHVLAANDPAAGQQQRGGRNHSADLCMENATYALSSAVEGRFLELAGVGPDATNKAKALFQAITSAFDQQLDGEDFLDNSTRIEAKVKLAKMVSAVGVSGATDDYADLVIDKGQPYALNMQRVNARMVDALFAGIGKPVELSIVDFPAPMVNAAYDPMHNKVNVPGGILGGYFFSAAAKNLSNLAAIGSVLGHELTHGFDDEGRLFDGDGDLRDWWSPSVASEFETRAQCLVDQYSGFAVENVTDPNTGKPMHVNGKQTLGENIADNGGLRIAYRAAKIDQKKATNVVAGFTPAQQFFISFGQLYCEKSDPKYAAMLLQYDVHSPGKARVNLPLANFDKFAEAFSCHAGAAMAPANRCSVW